MMHPIRISKRVTYPLVACLIMVFAILATVFLPTWLRPSQRALPKAAKKTSKIPMEVRIMGKAVVYGLEISQGTKDLLWAQVESFNAGSILQKQCFIVLSGEFGQERAFAHCKGLSLQVEQGMFFMTEEEQEAQYMLERIYVHQEKLDSFSDKEKEMLSPLGWFGRLAVARPGSTHRETVIAEARICGLLLGGGPLLLVILGVGGLIGLILALLYTKKRLPPAKLEPSLYAETFACWMLGFLVLQIAGSFVGSYFFPNSTLLIIGLCTLASLLALYWPIATAGASWKTMRQDIGLTLGQKPWVEILVGLGGYATGIPFLALGLLVMFVLARIVGVDLAAPMAAAHPIAVLAMQADLWTKIQILFVASVVAPIVEETFFRGVFYRFVRSVTEAAGLSSKSAILWSTNASILASGTICGFVFALVHPQGWIAVPVLMAMAWNFTLLREWRGSLLSAMITHGVSNGVTLSTIIVLAAQ